VIKDENTRPSSPEAAVRVESGLPNKKLMIEITKGSQKKKEFLNENTSFNIKNVMKAG